MKLGICDPRIAARSHEPVEGRCCAGRLLVAREASFSLVTQVRFLPQLRVWMEPGKTDPINVHLGAIGASCKCPRDGARPSFSGRGKTARDGGLAAHACASVQLRGRPPMGPRPERRTES